MVEMIAVSGPGFRAELASHPVRGEDFDAFGAATGLSPDEARRRGSPEAPVVEVSQVEAEAYCEWLNSRGAGPYRLPSMAELQALVDARGAGQADPEVWSEENWHTAALVGGLKAHYLCEWTQEKEKIDRPDGEKRVLGSIFYPPWMREGSSHTHAQAHLLATEGYTFVTFRLARSL